ncbi:hypothetical protein SOVF_163630 [Spinacia oleracea]|nr:hypothetical protein SOVF_163630 [Spinacia oleracea]
MFFLLLHPAAFTLLLHLSARGQGQERLSSVTQVRTGYVQFEASSHHINISSTALLCSPVDPASHRRYHLLASAIVLRFHF